MNTHRSNENRTSKYSSYRTSIESENDIKVSCDEENKQEYFDKETIAKMRYSTTSISYDEIVNAYDHSKDASFSEIKAKEMFIKQKRKKMLFYSLIILIIALAVSGLIILGVYAFK